MGDAVIEILRPGLQSSIQDLGRSGWMHIGISPSGAMDELSMRLANRLVGMPDDNTVIEMTQVGADIRFCSDMIIAITGADMKFCLNGKPVNNYRAISVNKNDELTFKGCHSGFRSYLSFNGQIQLPTVLDSCSTQLNASLGGLGGRALKSGDMITIKTTNTGGSGLHQITPLHFSGKYQVRFTEAPETRHFEPINLEDFQQHTYQVSQNMNRMGIRLSGQAVQPENYPSYDSRGLLPGAIQIPPDGQPIVAGKDAQTTGGYLRIGQVIQADLPVIGQLKPGDELTFLAVELQKARDLLKAQRAQLI